LIVRVTSNAYSLALPLLHNLLRKPLGHFLPLHYAPRLYWCVFAFPITASDALAYIIHIVTGLLILIPQVAVDFSIPCVAISISLNVLLTSMIVIRLALHNRNVRAASGSPAGIDGFYKAIATMLIESSALYTVNSLLLIGLWIANSGAADIFLPIVAETQVRTSPYCDLKARRLT